MAVLMLGARSSPCQSTETRYIWLGTNVVVFARDRRLELPVMKTDCNPPFLHHGAE